MTRPEQKEPRRSAEQADNERGRHNRLGYLDVDERDSSSERSGEEKEVSEEIDQPQS